MENIFTSYGGQTVDIDNDALLPNTENCIFNYFWVFVFNLFFEGLRKHFYS